MPFSLIYGCDLLDRRFGGKAGGGKRWELVVVCVFTDVVEDDDES
jgi:hypothetical protein